MGLPFTCSAKLQNVANCLLFGDSYFNHTPILMQFSWLPLYYWAQFKGLALTFKGLGIKLPVGLPAPT